ncbi:synembryn-A [Hippocampus zosterae]|uniref:synembryn-A n=1 Tax=Hippocampus zosterae TaxID=109293 RepID=UPI00223C8C41|nr:synembryn-A [Hippocampus zosterae]
MPVDVEGIIRSIGRGDVSDVHSRLQEFNAEYARCFFFDAEERDRKNQRKLEEFRKNKVRESSDSNSDGDESDREDRGPLLRRSLAAVLVRFIRTGIPSHLLQVALRSLRILSRDKRVLGPLVTDDALLTLARAAGLSTTRPNDDDDGESDSDFYNHVISSLARDADDPSRERSVFDDDADQADLGGGDSHRGSIHHKELQQGRKDRRESKMEGDEEEEEEEEDGVPGEEVQRKEALKVLCNVVYNSTWAQERFSALRLICGLRERLSSSAASSAPSSVDFYQLRLAFLVTALRPELSAQLQQDGGVSVLSAALQGCLEVRWKEQYECVLDPAAPPVSPEASQRIVEILKILFNITHRSHRQALTEVDADLYRHLVAILRLCLMRKCVTPEDTDELQGHTVNLLSALPLQCLDVLLTVPLEPDSEQCRGVNMDCVQILLLFMERRLESGDKIKEKVTPILNLLTESCRAHKETRHFIRTYVLPPLRDVSQRPEEGCTVKSRLIRLMTHLDTDLKHCAADLIFVLCKENVRRFVKYTGYGNAAGLLATRGLLGGPTARTSCGETTYSSDSDSDTEEYRRVKDRVNPVTGRVEAQLPDPMEGMTEEEKEEEAKRLIKIFNKLSRDNVIQPMGVDADGKLVPMAGLRDESPTEESASDSDTAELEEKQ